MTYEVTVVGKYLDTIWLSAFGEVEHDVLGNLRGLKEEMKARRVDNSEAFDIEGVPGGKFRLAAKAQGHCQFILWNGAFRLEITTDSSRPTVRIRPDAARI